ncbi:uncharacterized protein LOC127864318 isoform X1 [Dreissena polymorpha]|uniref:uncharacterized protein LOC127864318 isoform X1 n=1 Tax=Dreissena polymorpha TaxID=45954 RepID=UPI002263AC71|nr:uncharacterized protein LOC127864318 isoform X1 [Dreissena polymorpha]
MFSNTKTRVRDKFKSSQKTGGGPAKPLKASEELILQFLIDRPQLDGIIGGLDTSGESSSVVPSLKTYEDTENVIPVGEYSVEMKSSISNQAVRTVSDPPTSTSSVVQSKVSADVSSKMKERNKISKRARKAVEEDLYSLEKKSLLLEIVLLEQKIAHDKELQEL